MRRSAALVALVALAATAGGGLAQGDGARDEPLARDVDPSAKVSALGGAPHESGWSNGEYWERGDDAPGAEDPNGSSSDVYDAVLALGAVPYRQCLVVVKNGALVHESYDERRGFDRDTPMESDSVGIIATVALVGAATQRGLFRLDQPVMSYGVRGMQDKFGAYAQLVTPRHLLAQTHGGGEVPPGQTFRRDDDPVFLATLFELIESTSGVSVREFARVALVEPLGLARGSIFGGVEDDENDDARTIRSFDADGSAENGPTAASKDVALAYGRHVRLTCRDIAKLAQLFLNGGVWREETPPRKNRQIVSAQFAREAFSPRAHFPRLNKAFGLGVWVHDPVTNVSEEDSSHGVECCAPVTGMRACGESASRLLGPLLGDLSVGGPAERVGVFLGDEGSAVFVLPDTKTAVVSLGRTVAGSTTCPVGLERATAGAGVGGSLGGAFTERGGAINAKPRRDDYALLKVLWSAARPATRSSGEGYGSGASALAGYGGGAYAEETTKLTEPSSREPSSRSERSERASSRVAEKDSGRERSATSTSVRDLVTSAFRDSFARAIGDTGTTATEDAAYVPGVGSGLASNSVSAFGGSETSRVDAEVRRLTAARSKWFAETQIRLTAEDRNRRADYDKKIEALEKTQAKYKTAYTQAKLEILAAAEEEKKATRRERDADAAANAARWQATAVLAQQKAQQEQLDKREREVKLAQAEYAEALAEARAARSEAAGGMPFDAPGEDSGTRANAVFAATAAEEIHSPAKTKKARETVAETPSPESKRLMSSRSNPSHTGSRPRPSSRRVETRGTDTDPPTTEPVGFFPSRSSEASPLEKDTSSRSDVALDVNDLDFKANGLLDGAREADDEAADDDAFSSEKQTSGDEAEASETKTFRLHPRRKSRARSPSPPSAKKTPSPSTPSDVSLRASPNEKEKETPPVSSTFSGDVRLALPASEATVNSADDFLSSLSPSLKTRVSARLGALRDLDEALEKALADDEKKDRGESNEDVVLKTGAKKKKSAVAALGAFRAQEIGAFVSSAEHARSSGYESVEEKGEKRESVSTKKSGFSRRTPEASLGTSLWDSARTFFGLQTASEAPVDVGSCLCACPGGGGGGGAGGGVDACYDVDLSVAADADGPAACARLAQGANADVCGATGVVQRCEAPGASERGAVGATSSSRSKKKKHSSSSKRARAHAHASKETAKLGSLSDALRAHEEESARPLRFGVLGSVQSVGAYECVKTAQCPSSDAESEESSRAFSFLVEAYECDAVSFAQCVWAPAVGCPAQTDRPGMALGASKFRNLDGTSGDVAFGVTPRSAVARATDKNSPPASWREWATRLESFVWGAAFVAFAVAAIATAKARAAGEKRAHDEKSVSLFYQRREDEESAVSFAGDAGDARRRLTRDDEKESSTESTRQRESETTLARRGFGTDPRALTLGVWQAFSPGHGREDDETAGEREPLLAKTKTQTQTQTRESRARRKVVFDVDDTTSEDVAQGSTDETAPADSEKEAESRLVAAAERAAKAARAARLERAKAAREDAERRAKRARAKTGRKQAGG
jgi:hypothetical protein